VKAINRRADIVFGPSKVAVFVHGCFWHGCEVHYVAPKSNAEFWRAKRDGNIARDEDTAERLRAEGWAVVIAWEHDDPTRVADEVERLVRSRSHASEAPPPD
jgi:DNA mismatch endonuclease (patch repair protein)